MSTPVHRAENHECWLRIYIRITPSLCLAKKIGSFWPPRAPRTMCAADKPEEERGQSADCMGNGILILWSLAGLERALPVILVPGGDHTPHGDGEPALDAEGLDLRWREADPSSPATCLPSRLVGAGWRDAHCNAGVTCKASGTCCLSPWWQDGGSWD